MADLRIEFTFAGKAVLIETSGVLAELLKDAETSDDIITIFARIADARQKLINAMAFGGESEHIEGRAEAWNDANEAITALGITQKDLCDLPITEVLK